MRKRLILMLATLCTVGFGMLLTYESTQAVDSSRPGNVEAVLQAGTPTAAPATSMAIPTKPPTSTPGPTGTAQPTATRSGSSTTGVRPTPIQGPPPGLGGGGVPGSSVLIDPLIGKRFVTAGFPGLATGMDTQGYYQYAKNRKSEATLQAVWYIQVQQAGYYDVYAYVPSGPNATHTAQYHVFQDNTLGPPIVVDQALSSGQWVNLGSYYLVNAAIDAQSVTLDNQTTEADSTTTVLFSTVFVVFKP
jgi:hypothetical protein